MYEGLFLIDNAHANMEWDTVVKHIHDILQKNGAEILKTEKFFLPLQRNNKRPVLIKFVHTRLDPFKNPRFQGKTSLFGDFQRYCFLFP